MGVFGKLAAGVRGVGRKAVAVVLGVAPVAAFADGVTFDPTETLALVTSAQTFIVAVGTAVLALFMVAKGIKWARKAG